MTIKISLGAALLIILLLIVCTGCAPIEGSSIANPQSSVQIDPLKGIISAKSGRDDKFRMDEMSVNIPASAPGPLAGTTVSVKGLDLDASASKVRKSNAGQIDAFADYKIAEGEAAANVIDAVGDASGQVLSGLSRLKRSEKANTGYQVILALFAFALAMFLLLVFGGLLVYLVKKVWSVLFPAKTANDPMSTLLGMLLNNKAST